MSTPRGAKRIEELSLSEEIHSRAFPVAEATVRAGTAAIMATARETAVVTIAGETLKDT